MTSHSACSPALQTIITTATVASGVFAPGHLGERTRIVPFEMVDEALARTHLVNLPARLARPQHWPVLHSPAHWPRATAWLRLWKAVFVT